MPGKNYRPAASPARQAALEVGTLVRTRKAFTSEVIASHIDPSGLSPEDKAFATRLALGVTSTWGTLDELIDRHLNAPKGLEPCVRDALRISCYEIIFLDKSGYAAVDQGVELVKCVTPKASGLANAVLRKIAAEKGDFPFGDPKSDIEALARLYAFPVWLARLLVDEDGYEEAKDFMEASNGPAPLFLAVNSLKATDGEVEKAFSEAGATVREVALDGMPVPGCLYLKEGRALQRPRIQGLFAQGKILVSDAASQLVVESTLPASLEGPFLEIGAGRGTKSILFQSGAKRRFGRQLPLQVLDLHGFKVRLLKSRASAYGAHIEKAHVADACRLGGLFDAGSLDTVFIDAPCSGLGTLRRHPEIRWRIQEQDIHVMAEAAFAMLEEAAPAVKVGGTLAYSTCTVTREENQATIRRFLESEAGAGYRLEPIAGKSCIATRLSPGSSDAHFAVRMARVK